MLPVLWLGKQTAAGLILCLNERFGYIFLSVFFCMKSCGEGILFMSASNQPKCLSVMLPVDDVAFGAGSVPGDFLIRQFAHHLPG